MRKIDVLWHSCAVPLEKYSKIHISNEVERQKLLRKWESFHALTLPWWVEECIQLLLKYENAGATVLWNHAYRAGDRPHKSRDELRYSLSTISDLTGRVYDTKQPNTQLMWNKWTYHDLNRPLAMTIEDAQRKHLPEIQEMKNHRIDFCLHEAATTINEVIWLSRLCEKAWIPLKVSFFLVHDALGNPVIPDPSGYISLQDAIYRVDEQTWWYIKEFGVNCGATRDDFVNVLDGVQDDWIKEKVTIIYPNHNFCTKNQRDVGDIFHDYEQPIGEWTEEVLLNNKNISTVWECCNTTPEIIWQLVRCLREKEYIVWR